MERLIVAIQSIMLNVVLLNVIILKSWRFLNNLNLISCRQILISFRSSDKKFESCKTFYARNYKRGAVSCGLYYKTFYGRNLQIFVMS
jgi:chemotaxis methyl-accepting protein methylase